MAEAEDVIVDAARHATAFLQQHWRRRARRAHAAALGEHAERLELLLAAAFGLPLKIRAAEAPAPPTLLRRLFRAAPHARRALPATDGRSVWLPETLDTVDPAEGLARYRLMALRQGMRALRGSAAAPWQTEPASVQDLYLVLEAHAADAELARLLPGTQRLLQPPVLPAAFARTLEEAPSQSPEESLQRARRQAAGVRERLPRTFWSGELREPCVAFRPSAVSAGSEQADAGARSARLARTPKVREALPGEDETRPGAWMVQTAQPHEHAEDPMGLQRPTDRDDATAAEDLAESLADLPEARLVTRPGAPKEVLLSREAPVRRATAESGGPYATAISYPEWDYRIAAYVSPGAAVRTPSPALGDPAWAAATLARHAALLGTIRRRFELLRARRVHLRRQLEGEEIDLEACVESAADFHAGLPRSDRLYQTLRPARREMALALLIDVSGSTDSWVSGTQRVIDVEREALLLVCIALEAMGESYAVHAFSGEGRGAVTVRAVKSFAERHGETVSRRIAALEPERYTRVGAALRHVTGLLMREPARHRLLLLLSDGKPNDIDHYEGRYGVEDMRQAVLEAKLQGIFPFCLTVDRAAAGYLTSVFGHSQYALLPKPELLPGALIEWIRRLACH